MYISDLNMSNFDAQFILILKCAQAANFDMNMKHGLPLNKKKGNYKYT